MKWKEAVSALDECEQKLRRQVAEAAAQGDYAGVHQITGWAMAVAAMAAEGRGGTVWTSVAPRMADAVAVAGTNGGGTRPGVATLAAPLGRKARPAAEDYPRFFRRGDELVKVGWSKKDRREYNH